MRKFKSFLDPLPRVCAHRGDSHYFPENTIEAFISASRMSIDIIETDVHLTKDNKIVIWHDDTLERNTDGKGRIEDHTLEELLEYDAGYTFTKDGGKTFPFRGKGVKIMTLDEALKACPDERFNIDLKTNDTRIVDEYIKVIRDNKAEDRVCTASFHLNNLKTMRKKAPDMLTSITTVEVAWLLFRLSVNALPKTFKRKIIFQVPLQQGPVRIISEKFIKEMHKRGAIIMVWTINNTAQMDALFDMGVDTIMTDNPRLLIERAKAKNII